MSITGRSPEQKKLEVIEAVAALARERLPAAQAVAVEAFFRRYYAGVSAEDLCEREVPDLYGAALAHFGLLRERRPAELKLRVYNPGFEEHGWQSTHTVVEMVTDDMRFLVDSLVMELNRHGATIHLMVHPILHVVRDAQELLIEIAGPTTRGARAESVIHVELDRETDPREISVLREDLGRVLTDVRTAVEDWPKMRAALARAIETFSPAPYRVLPDHPVEELYAFLEWLEAGNFTLLGCRDHVRDAPGADLRPVAGSGLGIWRDPPAGSRDRPGHGPAESVGIARDTSPVVITKASTRSTVHRPSYLDYIGVRRFGDDGQITGELGLLGLHVSEVYYGDPKAIPLLRHKIEAVMARAAFAPEGHRPGVTVHPRVLSARRALPDLAGRALGNRDGDPASAGTAARAAVRAPRPLRPVSVVPGVRAA